LTGTERDRDSFDRLLAVMTGDPDRVLVLCARSLLIRLNAVEESAVAHAVVTDSRRTRS
jgi:hypothetical protein